MECLNYGHVIIRLPGTSSGRITAITSRRQDTNSPLLAMTGNGYAVCVWLADQSGDTWMMA